MPFTTTVYVNNKVLLVQVSVFVMLKKNSSIQK